MRGFERQTQKHTDIERQTQKHTDIERQTEAQRHSEAGADREVLYFYISLL